MSTQMMQPTQTLHEEVKAEKRISLTKIMVLTDFSEVSDVALQYGMALARRYDAIVYLTHILSPNSYALAEPGLAEMTYEKTRQAAEQGFHQVLISGKMHGVPHETLLYEGAFWPTVERLIQERGIDLVVTGTHGRGSLKKVVIGSAAEEVFRQAGCAVLTVGPQIRKQPPHEVDLKDILFATDFGPGAARAAQYAFSLAQEHGARLTVLHVVEDAKTYTREGEQRLRRLNIARMKQFMPAESENWCSVGFRVAFGAAADEILSETRETNADLLIMGAKSSKAFPGHAPLTIAYSVAAKASCPVLTVRG